MAELEKQLTRDFKMEIKLGTNELHEKMVRVAVKFAVEGVQRNKEPHDIAEMIVKAFTRAMGHSHWHCVVGKRYGSNVSHEPSYYLYFYVGQWAVMLFRTKERCEREQEKLRELRDQRREAEEDEYDEEESEYY